MTLPDIDNDIELPSLGRTNSNGTLTPENEGHWRPAAQGLFTVPTCDECGTQRWPLLPACYACHSLRWSWQSVPGTGTVYTYTWIDAPTHPGHQLENVVVIELDGSTGVEPVRVPGWVVDVERGELACGMAVEAEYETVADGIGVPHWRPRACS